MVEADGVNQRVVWVEEALHRATNMRQLAISLERLADRGRIKIDNRARTMRRVFAMERAYQTLDIADEVDPDSCARGIRDIATGLVEIFGRTAGFLKLSLQIQPLSLSGERRRALLLAVSELVMNALRHAFIDRQTGIIHVGLDYDQVCQEGTLIVADDGVGPSTSAQ